MVDPAAPWAREVMSSWARLALPLEVGAYDLADASGTVRGVPGRWSWTVEHVDEVPHGVLVAMDAMAEVLRAAGGSGTDLTSLTDPVQRQLAALASEHGPRTKVAELLGEHHPLLIATEECDRLLSGAGRLVAAEVGRRHSGAVEALHASGGGVPKVAIAGAELESRGLVGDAQATRAHHGRPFQAVCLYSAENIAALQDEGHPIGFGTVGENLTLSGLDWSELRPGIRLALGGQRPVVLELSSWASPCKSIAGSFVDGRFDRIDHDKHPASARAYAWVVQPGHIAAGDRAVVLP